MEIYMGMHAPAAIACRTCMWGLLRSDPIPQLQRGDRTEQAREGKTGEGIRSEKRNKEYTASLIIFDSWLSL